MTKNELMKMARACGFRSNSFSKACTKHSSGAWVGVEDELLAFSNTILERAAVECDAMTRIKAAEHEDLRDACAAAIRSLKITK